IARTTFGLHKLVQMHHLELMNTIMLTTGSIVGYAYAMEFFIAWYSGNPYERFCFINRATGPYWWAYAMLILCNILTPQLLWFKRVRINVPLLFCIALVINCGMWLERFVIVVTSLHRDFLPSAWGMYQPTFWDWSTFLGTLGLFVALLFLFLRFLPMISIFEMRTILPAAKVDEDLRTT
ncbi:MAG TPA: hypothetical protein VGJ29_13850, partial [Vicinamibacterales bacterium]